LLLLLLLHAFDDDDDAGCGPHHPTDGRREDKGRAGRGVMGRGQRSNSL